MADLPEASVTVDDEAGAFAGSAGYAVVLGAVYQNADITPRVYSSTKGILDQHGYSQAADYAAWHFEETKKPIIFIGLPIVTAGAVASQDPTGVTGSSVISAAASASGVLEEVDAYFKVTKAGTIGANGIVGVLSLDGGRTEKIVRLGTSNSYVIPYVGVTLSFGAGTLAVDDIYYFRTTAPMWDSAGLASARTALAAQLKPARSWIIAGDLPNSTFAGYVTTEANGYETANDRFTYARVSVRDLLPLGRAAKLAAQSFTFAEVGVSGDTITRDAGSWLADGFRVGDTVTFTGTVSNNVTLTIGALTDTVMTATTTDLAAEVIAGNLVTCVATTTKAAALSSQAAAFAGVDAQKRIDISYGRGRKQSYITGWLFRRPSAWALSVREYQHDLHIPPWRKADGPLDGVTLDDAEGNLEEFDERVDGGALAERFSCLRTWANGPNGAFGALSMTRASEGSLMSRTHNMAVVNLACTIAQAETENAIGQVLVLKDDGKAEESSLNVIEGRVNTSLELYLLKNGPEGPRASMAKWTASRNDTLNIPGAELNGTLDLMLNGTLEKINTRVRVLTGG